MLATGKVPLVYSVDIAMRITKSPGLFLHTDYLSKDGKTTFTREDTTLKITPIELGARFLIGSKKPCKQKLLRKNFDKKYLEISMKRSNIKHFNL